MKYNNLEIREATLQDLDSILDLCRQLVLYDYQYDDTLDRDWSSSAHGRELFRERIVNKDGLVLVAVLNEKIVGYLIGGLIDQIPYRKVKILAELEEIFILDEYRSYAIGSKLIKNFFEWCHKIGAEKIQVVVSRENHRAIKFYSQIGFHEHNIVLEASPSILKAK